MGPSFPGKWKLIDSTTGTVIARRVGLADGFCSRFRGLMLRKRFPRGEALFFDFKKPGRNSVHMFFVWFPIDLLYLDSSFRVVEVRSYLRPWQLHRSRVVSRYLVELPAGTVSRLGVRLGHKIRLEKRF